jgi:protoporphyrinogen IX oxidase
MSYDWLKVVHILALVAWMAGLFYLPRLMVYHADKSVGGEMDETFKTMERRLLGAIMRPALLATLLSGFGLMGLGQIGFSTPWLALKLFGVIGMVGFHGLLERHVAQFRRGQRGHTSRYYRVINEVPTVLLIWIVIFVVIKPF